MNPPAKPRKTCFAGTPFDCTSSGQLNCCLLYTSRKSLVGDPLRRVNTEDNTPAVLHLRLVPGDQLSLTVAPKGAGSENMTSLHMLKPSASQQDVEDAIVQAVDVYKRQW